MTTERINARLPNELAKHVTAMVGQKFETPSEYIRHLIRQDIEKQEEKNALEAINDGLNDLKNGDVIVSKGSWKDDKGQLNE